MKVARENLGKPREEPVVADIIRGKVINTKDTITFHGCSVEEAIAAFRESVDDYLAFCESLGEAPEKPFSGNLTVRLQPEVHRALSAIAQTKGVSLNRFVSGTLKQAARKAMQSQPVKKAAARAQVQSKAGTKAAEPKAKARKTQRKRVIQ